MSKLKMLLKFVCCSLVLIPMFIWSSVVNADVKRVSVHDPSIFYHEGEYYIFGSHLAQAKSADLLNWTPMFNQEYDNPSSILGDLTSNLNKPFQWAGYDDADTANGGYSIWAADVIWNADYQWESGDTGAFMYYFSSSSTWRRSVISFAVSKAVEGPYEVVDTLIYSGFTQKDATDGSTKNTNYKNTNVYELIENGTIDGFNPKWNWPNGDTYFSDYAPNAIDPNVFFGNDGKMYMTYGSWSGGIFILELNPQTGKPVYPGVDSVNAAGNVVDRYFGTHLLGGYHQSGEAPYIVYDQVTDYYYLFITYGGLTREGGYNMRLFRSKTPDGKYVDAKGNTPEYDRYTTEPINDQYGIKVMGNYEFDCLDSAYMSPGHNSAFIDENGNWFLVYHTRFNSGTEYHEVRVHEMLRGKDGWPVATPFEYVGKSETTLPKEKKLLVGNYEFVNHGTNTSGLPIPKASITLSADGQVSGALSGTWDYEYDGKTNVGVIRIQNSDVEYEGQFYIQKDESKNRKEVLTFSALGSNNEVIWGVKNLPDDATTDSTSSSSTNDATTDSSTGSSSMTSTDSTSSSSTNDATVDSSTSSATVAPTDSSSTNKTSDSSSKSSINSSTDHSKTHGQLNKKDNTNKPVGDKKILPKTGEKENYLVILGVGIIILSLLGVMVRKAKLNA